MLNPRVKKALLDIVSAVLALAVFYFLGRVIQHNWAQIEAYTFHFNFVVLFAACAVYMMTLFILGAAWWLILKYLHKPIPFLSAICYFCITFPAKYIPGKIWIAVARMRFCKPRGISNSVTILAAGIEGFMEILAGAYISLFALFTIPIFHQYSFGGFIAVVCTGMLLLIPEVFYFLVNLYLKILKKPQLEKEHRASFAQLLLLQIIYAVAMFAMGSAQFLFLQSFAPVDYTHALLFISVGALTYSASVAAIFTPSGLGVREGIWYLALKPAVLPHIALIYAFVSRLWTIILEVIAMLICLPLAILISRKEKNRVQLK